MSSSTDTMLVYNAFTDMLYNEAMLAVTKQLQQHILLLLKAVSLHHEYASSRNELLSIKGQFLILCIMSML